MTAIRIQVRRGTAALWAAVNPVLAEGEPGFETDTGDFKIGDGVTAWNALAYQGGGVTDHGALTGLADDDHPQYHNNARGDARYDLLGAAAAAQAASQPLDSDLTAIAALAPSNDDVLQRKAGAWTNRTMAQLVVDLNVPSLGANNVWTGSGTYTPATADGTAVVTVDSSVSTSYVRLNDNGTIEINADVGTGVYPIRVRYNGSVVAEIVYSGDIIAYRDFVTANLTSRISVGGGRVYVASGALDVLQVNNGVMDTYRDLRLRNVRTNGTTVADLVAAATAGAGARGFVTDANSNVFGAAAVGGGANSMPVWCNGAGWFIG